MVWLFKKKKAPELPPAIFKTNQAFFENQCKFGQTELRPEKKAIVAIVRYAPNSKADSNDQKRLEDGRQIVSLRVASADGGFLATGGTPSERGDVLKEEDLVLWLPMTFSEEFAYHVGDRRAGWVGLILATIKPEIPFAFICQYD